MHPTFYQVCIPEPATILGVRLRPLSLGHLIILHYLDSAFVNPEVELTPHDLALSVLVCSGTYEEGLELISNPPSHFQFRLWFWKLSRPSILQKLGIKRESPVNLAEKANMFSEYMRHGASGPYYSYDVGEAVEIDCPSIQIVRVSILKAFNLTDSEVMNRPWALCKWDHVTLKAMDRQVKMTSRDEIADAQEVANRLYEKLNKELNVRS